MVNVFVVHGAEGSPNENWFPWLEGELKKFGCKVFVPEFPTPENQTFDEWMKIWQEYDKFVDEDSIVIGHSLGVLFLLNILERSKIKAAFFVAGFAKLPGNRFDESMKTFAGDFNFVSIKKNCQKFFVYHSDDDPYVKIGIAEDLAEKLRVSVTLIKNAGHFNNAAGYDKFPELLQNVKNFL